MFSRRLGSKMEIDHIGYAVKRMDRAIDSFEKLGYTFGSEINDLDRNVKLVFGKSGNYRIELVCPLDNSKPSPVDSFLRNVGPTPYHICYQSNDLEKEIDILKSQGFKLVIEPKQAIAFGLKRVAFLLSIGLGLFEIVEKNEEV